MPAMEVVYRRLDAIQEADRNPRTHTAAQIRLIEKSLQRFGWATPMGLADGKLIYGHARRMAAMNLRDRKVAIAHNDDPDQGPTIDLSHLSAADRRAYIITDNQSAALAGWDTELLGLELRELAGLSFDLTLTGFSKNEIAEYTIEPVGDERPGALLELASITIAEPVHTVSAGDHWLLAERHHLLCVSVIEDWRSWKDMLRKNSLFVPYPGPFVPFGSKANDFDLVMVQPDAYAAGHLLDRFAEVRGEAALRHVGTVARMTE